MCVSVCEFLYYADRTRMKSWKFVYLSSMVCLNPPGGRYHSSSGWQVRDTHPVVWPLVGLLSLKILHASESYSILIAQGTPENPDYRVPQPLCRAFKQLLSAL